MNSQKHIVINASTAATGGGLLVAIDLIRAVCLNPRYKVTLICPDIIVYRKLSVEARLIFVPRIMLKFYTRWWLDYFWLSKTIKKLNPGFVISLGNLPAIVSTRQIMFNDNAFVSERYLKEFGFTSREFAAHGIRKWIFHRRLKFVKLLVVQSGLEKNKFAGICRSLTEIISLPPLLPSHLLASEKLHTKLPGNRPNQVRLACLSYIHGHKNIGVLVEVLDIAEKENFPLQIVFTLSPANSLLGKRLKHRLRKHLLSGSAINLGKIKPGQVSDLMHQINGLILPSLNESYSLNYFEAMYFNRPLFVSDRVFAREICGSNAFYFDPMDAADIFSKIVAVFSCDAQKHTTNSTGKYLKYSVPEDIYSLIDKQ